jgi:DNA-binding GntR family transcriptional regulator
MKKAVKAGDAGVRSLPLNEQIAARLRDDVLSGRLAAEQRLAQHDLATRFQVSRIPVRDALRMLEAEGLVTSDSRFGAVVAPLSIENVEELYELRLMLEPANARRAVPALRPEDDDAMERHLRAMEALVDDPRAWFEVHARFHRVINERSRRERTNLLLENLRGQTERYVRFFQMVEANPAGLLAQHERIRVAALRRDTEAVVTGITEHLKLVRDHVTSHLQENLAIPST